MERTVLGRGFKNTGLISIISRGSNRRRNALCEQQAELMSVKAGGIDVYHCALWLKRSQDFFLLTNLMHH
jgi:hypothetical protein